jgi:hypothetical protein
LAGSVAASNCVGNNCTWTITNKRLSTGQTTVHVVVDGLAYVNAMAGAVEVNTLTACNQYPVNGIFYSTISVYNGSLTQVFPTWTKTVQAGLSPSCSFSIASPYSSLVKLYHNPAPAPVLSSLSTNPSPPKRYLPFTITLTGSGFNPATVEAVITGGPTSGCPSATPCYILNNQFSTKTSTQLVVTYSMSIAATYNLRVRNGDGGTLSVSGFNYTVVP